MEIFFYEKMDRTQDESTIRDLHDNFLELFLFLRAELKSSGASYKKCKKCQKNKD